MRALKLPMVRIFYLFIFVLSLGISPLWAVKKASIVICAETGAVHHESNADAITHPASLTKMMTLYMTFKALREKKLTLNQKLPVSKFAAQQGPCKLWLKPGTTITVRDAILGMITKSANDASVALAETLGGGSEAHFATLMTQQAQKLGMSQTVFKNASGLPDKNLKQVTTARDMATLSRALYKHFPEYYPLFKIETFAYKGVVHGNHNKLLGKIPGVDGIKTGFINAAGFNLAASCVRDNKRIIAIVMGGASGPSRDKQMVKLIEATHSYLAKGGNPSDREGAYASLDALIQNLNSFENNEKAPKIRKAAYVPSAQKQRAKKARYQTLDHLITNLNEKPKGRIVKVNAPLKNKPKNSPVKTQASIKKKSLPKNAKIVKTASPKINKPNLKKTAKKPIKKLGKKK
jgi:D-alanyl-D-alanine carboxypeptidase